MKKLFTTSAALSLAILVLPALAGQSHAAPTKDPSCKYANAQRNPVAWNAYYHCLGTPPKPTRAAVHTSKSPTRNPYCAMASAQRNLVAWNTYYHCLNR